MKLLTGYYINQYFGVPQHSFVNIYEIEFNKLIINDIMFKIV